MSTISDWEADYTGADTNVPASSTAIPFPANTTTDLGEVLRDTKAVIRSESLNKGWYPDSVAATYVSSTQFTLVGDVTDSWTPSVAVKLNQSNTVYTWIKDVNLSGGNTDVIITNAALTNTLTTVTRGAFMPPSTPSRSENFGYPMGTGSSIPPRVSQRGKFVVSDSTNTVTVPFIRTEPDTNYRVLIQLVSSDLLVDLDAQRFTTITKSTSNMALTLAAAPGASHTLEFEFALVRAI
jgi:hypothetical protein